MAPTQQGCDSTSCHPRISRDNPAMSETGCGTRRSIYMYGRHETMLDYLGSADAMPPRAFSHVNNASSRGHSSVAVSQSSRMQGPELRACDAPCSVAVTPAIYLRDERPEDERRALASKEPRRHTEGHSVPSGLRLATWRSRSGARNTARRERDEAVGDAAETSAGAWRTRRVSAASLVGKPKMWTINALRRVDTCR